MNVCYQPFPFEIFKKKNFWVSFINILNLFKKIFKNPIFEHFKILMKNLMKKISWVSFKIFLEIFKTKKKRIFEYRSKTFFWIQKFSIKVLWMSMIFFLGNFHQWFWFFLKFTNVSFLNFSKWVSLISIINILHVSKNFLKRVHTILSRGGWRGVAHCLCLRTWAEHT